MSVWGTVPNSLKLRRFSWKHGINDFPLYEQSSSRLEIVDAQLQVQSENLMAANSRIRDVDVAEESTRLAKYNILVQSGTAMLAQANQLPESVLRLLN